MLEGVFHKDDQQQRRDGDAPGQTPGSVEPDIDGVRITDAHEFDVVSDELDVLFERNALAPRIVEDVAHHLREFDHGLLCIFGIDVDQGVDVVERVHEEVRIDLVFEIIHLRLEVLALERLHLLLVAHRLVNEFDAGVYARHEESQQHVPVNRQVGERGLARYDVGAVVREHAFGQEPFIEFDRRKDGRDREQVGHDVEHIFLAQHVARGDHTVVDQEDEQVGSDFPPGREHVLDTYVHLAEHLGIEHRHQHHDRPDHDVKQVFAYRLFLTELHEANIRKKSANPCGSADLKRQAAMKSVTLQRNGPCG